HPHGGQPLRAAGRPLAEADSALILLHGRGATAESILDLVDYLPRPGMTYLAPQAAQQTWYPLSFLSPLAQNEPYLSSALWRVGEVMAQVEAAGIPAERTFLGGFSQGACLAAEYAARHARRYGGLLLFSGGLIGPPGVARDYAGSLAGTPVFLGCSDVDPHIPLARVEETAEVLRRLGAIVDLRIYPRMGHTINQDEIEGAGAVVSKQ
uniref:alpha/beta hydrolase n=1 Tax=Promineifilum sp. TaxID=2664178 RepID=UPI0035B07334